MNPNENISAPTVVDGCCVGFTHLMRGLGHKGFSAVARTSTKGRIFRMLAFSAEHPFWGGTGTFAVSETGLRYCPFCGRDLHDWIAAHEEQHEAFLRFAEMVFASTPSLLE